MHIKFHSDKIRQSVNMSSISEELALFQPANKEQAIQRTEWINFRPIGQISKGSAIEFVIPGTSNDYVDLAKTRLNIQMRILKSDGSTVADDEVAVVNSILHSAWRQVDVSIGQKVITTTTGCNYAYKSIIDTLLHYGHNPKDSQLQAEGYFKDEANYFDNAMGNIGHIARKKLTADGIIADFEGPIHMDICQQKRAIPSGVQISIKLFPSDDSFRLYTETGNNYELEVVDAVLKVCHLKLSPTTLLAHNESLKVTPAVYPFWKSDIKTFTISAGSMMFSTDDCFQGQVPHKLIVGFTSSAAYSGSYSKNPFNFQNFNLNFLEMAVDGTPVPSVAFQPTFQEITDPDGSIRQLDVGYVHEYLSLFKNNYPQVDGNWISRQDYPSGYCLFNFDVCAETNKDLFSAIRSGHTRLSARFATPLSDPVTLIAYGVFPAEIHIDQTRNVIL